MSIVLLVMVLVAIWQFKNVQLENVQPNKSTTQENIITSKDLKLSITLPKGFEAIEKLGSINISSPKGSILVTQNGTNFDNLNDYISNSRNNLQQRMKNIQESSINSLDVVSAEIDGEKVYLIYANNRVYYLSTKDPSLFNVLDQIAQSFKYNP